MLGSWRGSESTGRNSKLLYLFDKYSLDTDRREVRHGAAVVPIEPQVFDLLEHLIRHRDRIVSKDDLIASIWQGRIVSESTISTQINAARCAIADSGGEQRLIKTIPRKGIRFVGDVREEPIDTSKPQKLLNIEPQFTLTEFRARVRFLDGTPWGNRFLDALRLAGLPK